MKRSTSIGILGFFLFIISILGHAQSPVDVSDEIMAANETFMEAIKSGDIEALVSLYSIEARVLPPNSPALEGTENIRAMWKAMLQSGPMNLQLKTVTAEAYGSTAIEEGRYNVLLPDGQVVDTGKYIVIWKKVEGKWLLYRDIFNTSQPPENQ